RRTVPIFATTYNLHGRPYCGENLEEWLRLPRDSIPDIVAIAFQEIVDLNVGQVLAASNANRLVWERTVMELLNIQLRQRGHGSEYVLIRSDQLVGVSLMIVTHNTVLPRMRNISSIKHKTGLWGMAGNKGAVAVSFDLDDSSFCIINSHLASGTTNVAERNDDFYNIYTNTRFMRNKGIDDHNYVLWLGDLNYRVDLPNPIVRDLVWKGDLDGLLRYDQLKAQAKQGRIFRDYQEGDIMFPPTYKYDTGTNNYDTSDKQRVPSWTDRILFRGQGLKLCAYYRDELTFSDHKPVSAVFEAQ
ncbi:Inositol-1,4,5-trisphosphate 5-phosphatase 1, partial [Spiromyces aspiralis]